MGGGLLSLKNFRKTKKLFQAGCYKNNVGDVAWSGNRALGAAAHRRKF
jgi:hypothetical protein